MTAFRWWIRLIIVSSLLAALGVLLFGTLHAIVIVPIWRRLLGGLPFALPAAAGLMTDSQFPRRRVTRLEPPDRRR